MGWQNEGKLEISLKHTHAHAVVNVNFQLKKYFFLAYGHFKHATKSMQYIR